MTDKTLRQKASENFNDFLQLFKKSGAKIGLSRQQLTEEEWLQLNKELAKDGVILVPNSDSVNAFMWFKEVRPLTSAINLKVRKEAGKMR